jgi:hypothetical protein
VLEPRHLLEAVHKEVRPEQVACTAAVESITIHLRHQQHLQNQLAAAAPAVSLTATNTFDLTARPCVNDDYAAAVGKVLLPLLLLLLSHCRASKPCGRRLRESAIIINYHQLTTAAYCCCEC